MAYQVQGEQPACRLAKDNNLSRINVDASVSLQLRSEFRFTPREGIDRILDNIMKRDLGTQAVVGRGNHEARIGKIFNLSLGYKIPGADNETATVESQC
jgi:hypothetical protein